MRGCWPKDMAELDQVEIDLDHGADEHRDFQPCKDTPIRLLYWPQ